MWRALKIRPEIQLIGGGSFNHYRVCVPQRQRVRVKDREEFERVEWIRSVRVYSEELARHPERFRTCAVWQKPCMPRKWFISIRNTLTPARS